MIEYRMRTPFATPTQTSRSTSGQHSARSIHKNDAHGRSHARHNPTEAFYHSEGRIEKNSRMKKTYPEKHSISTNNYHQENVPVMTTTTAGVTTTKTSSCCTIL
jgi:hypothetical protein